MCVVATLDHWNVIEIEMFETNFCHFLSVSHSCLATDQLDALFMSVARDLDKEAILFIEKEFGSVLGPL